MTSRATASPTSSTPTDQPLRLLRHRRRHQAAFADHNSGTRLEYPIVADVDRDGQVEIVVIHEPYNGPITGITVIGDKNNSWRPGRKIWNQHAYSITNIV
ncbi:hypothetical protein [Nannocystis sp.]|uniref:hypothetical protein n=1 Tax=Nannocystis sp. TaxID=1962667 RepID=UPI0025D2B0B6|nr:hypothetical protein [Nannocystis sp.]MBK7829435.1 hypothetical protein [Nannocystis sp.]